MAEELKVTQTQTQETPVNNNTNADNSLRVKQNAEQPAVTAEQMRKEYNELIVKQKDGLLNGRDQDRLKELKDKLGEKGNSIDTTPEDLHEEKGKLEKEKRDPLFVKKDILQYEEEQLFKLLNWLGDKLLDGIDWAAEKVHRGIRKGGRKLKDKIKEHYKDKPLPDDPMTKYDKAVTNACNTNKENYIESNNTELKNTKDSLNRIRNNQATNEDKQTAIYQHIQGLTPKDQKQALKDYEKDKEAETKEKNQIRTIATGLVRAKHAQDAMGNTNPTPPSNDELNQEIATMEAHIIEIAEREPNLKKRTKFLKGVAKLTEQANETIDKNIHNGHYFANDKYHKKYDKWYYKGFSNDTKRSLLEDGYLNPKLYQLYNTLELDPYGNIPNGQNQAAQTQRQTQQQASDTRDNTQAQESSVTENTVNDDAASNKTNEEKKKEEIIEEVKEKGSNKTEETITDEVTTQFDTPTPPQPKKEGKPEPVQEETAQPKLENIPEDKQIGRIIELKNELNSQYGRNINMEEAYYQFNLLKRKDPDKALDFSAASLPKEYRESFIETIKEMNPVTFPPKNKEQKTNTSTQSARGEIFEDARPQSKLESLDTKEKLTMPETQQRILHNEQTLNNDRNEIIGNTEENKAETTSNENRRSNFQSRVASMHLGALSQSAYQHLAQNSNTPSYKLTAEQTQQIIKTKQATK